MNKIHTLDRTAVFSELKRLIQQSLPIKGTYIKTLEKDDIFDQPVNKTSELQIIKVGNKSIYVPIVKEPEVAEGAIPEDMLVKVLAKIKDPKSRKIISEYLEQEKNQEVANKAVVKIEEAEAKNEDYQDVIDKKKELVDKIKLAADETELTKILTDNNVTEFKKELGEAGLKYSLAGLTKTINATKKKLETNRLVAQARAQQASQNPAPTPAKTPKQPPPAPIQPPITPAPSRARKQPPPTPPTPAPKVPTLITKLLNSGQNPPTPPAPPVLTPTPNKAPPTPTPTPAQANAFATTHTELFQRLDATRATKATKMKSIAQMDAFLVANGYDELYKKGSPQMKSALSKGRNGFINTYGLK